jgi:hypothetical protein
MALKSVEELNSKILISVKEYDRLKHIEELYIRSHQTEGKFYFYFLCKKIIKTNLKTYVTNFRIRIGKR